MGLYFSRGKSKSLNAEEVYFDLSESDFSDDERDEMEELSHLSSGGIALTIVYSLMLVKKLADGVHWEQTQEGGPGVMSVSKQVFEAWNNRPTEDKRPLPAFNEQEFKKFAVTIKTPEQLAMERTTNKMAARLDAEGMPEHPQLLAVVNDIKGLNSLWRGKDWQAYQAKIDELRETIFGLLPTLKVPPLTEKIIENLTKILEIRLPNARKNVPDGQSTLAPEPTLVARKPDEFIMGKNSTLQFVHERLPKDADFSQGLSTQAQLESESIHLETPHGSPIMFEGVKLDAGECIRASLVFDSEAGKIGILKQNSRGKVTNMSTGELDSTQKSAVAVEQAQMLLANWRPGSGNIIIRGMDPDMGNKVYAAILLLKTGDPDFKKIKIKSFVPHCEGPGTLDTESRFIDRHLSELTTELRTTLQQETTGLKTHFNSNNFKNVMNKMKPELETDALDIGEGHTL